MLSPRKAGLPMQRDDSCFRISFLTSAHFVSRIDASDLRALSYRMKVIAVPVLVAVIFLATYKFGANEAAS